MLCGLMWHIGYPEFFLGLGGEASQVPKSSLVCDENQQAATGKECKARGKESGIWVLARACSNPTDACKQLRRLTPLTHALSPRDSWLGWQRIG